MKGDIYTTAAGVTKTVVDKDYAATAQATVEAAITAAAVEIRLRLMELLIQLQHLIMQMELH